MSHKSSNVNPINLSNYDLKNIHGQLKKSFQTSTIVSYLMYGIINIVTGQRQVLVVYLIYNGNLTDFFQQST